MRDISPLLPVMPGNSIRSASSQTTAKQRWITRFSRLSQKGSTKTLMKDTTKQRIFWIIIAVVIAAAIIAFSSQDTKKSEDLSDSVAEILHMEQAEQYTRVSNQDIFFGLTLRKLAHVFLYALLGFSLYFVFEGIRARFPLAVGTAFCYGILDEFHQTMSGRIGRWQDTLIDLGGILIGTGLALLVLVLLRQIKKWYEKREEHRLLEQVLDALSLAAVLHYAVFRFLQSTMFQFYYSDRYKTATILLLIFFGGIRFLYLALKKSWAAGSPKAQSFLFFRYLLAFCLAIPFVAVGWMHDYKLLIFLPICCLCLYDMATEKIYKAFFATIGTCLAALIICCLSGTVRNIVGGDNGVSYSYGVINTTDFASYFTFLLLTAWCGMRTRKWYASVLFAVAAGIINYTVYLYTDSRTALYTGALMVFLMFWDCLVEHVFSRKDKLRRIGKRINWLSILAFPTVGALVVYLTARFAAQDAWALELEETLSGRLNTVLKPFQMYGVKPLGSTIEKMYGLGGTILGRFWSADYSYLDVGYAMLAIRYGWVITAIVMGLWMWMTAKALSNGKNRIAFALVVMAAHAFSEARILDVNFNIFLIMPFCAFASDHQKDEKGTIANKKLMRSVLVGSVLLVGVYLVLPKALSWLRTFFYLKSWNAGTSAVYSFAFCIGLVLLLWALGKSAALLLESRNRKYVLSLAAVFMLLAGSGLMVNNTIESGRNEQADRLKAEEQIIRQMQEAATMPIYAAEAEELYQRDGAALSGHLFSTEELLRNKGSIIVDQNIEALGIITAGGQYTQITEQSGLYSFDPAVIEALANAGYSWSRSYTGVRHVNLRDAALFNDVPMKDQLILSDSRQIITNNMITDQLFGKYQVSFTLSDFSAKKEGNAVLLEVIGENGDRTILQEKLTAKNFNSEGRCEHTMTYTINPTPSVYFGISTMEGTGVAIDDISWRQIEDTSEDLLHTIGTHESSGVKYAGNPDGTVTVKGEATGISFYNIYLNKSGFPNWMHKGKEYFIQIDDPSGMVYFEIFLYNADKQIILPALVSTKTSQVFCLPEDAYGIIIRFRALQGKAIDTTFVPLIYEY